MIGVNVFLSKEISLGRGIRQGCPLSALLFIVALEPLEILRRHQWYAHPMERRVIAYADDVNVFVHTNDINRLFHEIDKFCPGTQLKINRDKKNRKR